MNSLDPHRLGDLFAETSRETPQPDMEDEDEDNDGEIQVLGMENLQAKVAEVGSWFFGWWLKNKWRLFESRKWMMLFIVRGNVTWCFTDIWILFEKNYFTSSDPHHDISKQPG